MKIEADGVVIQIEITNEMLLGSLFQQLKSHISVQNKIITDLNLDGEELTQERQKELANTKAINYKSLKLATVDVNETSLRVLNDLRNQLGNLDSVLEQAHLQISRGDTQNALKTLQVCFEFWQTLLRGVDHITILKSIDLSQFVIDGEGGFAILQKLIQAFSRFNDAFKKQDIVLMADITQFELRPLVPKWEKIIDMLINKIKT